MSHTPDTPANDLLVHGNFIANVRIRRLAPHNDTRGSFTEFFSTDWSSTISPRQWSLVRSDAAACRGMHVHRYHDECYVLISGHGFLGLHDIRCGSPTERTSMMLELDGDGPCLIELARGVVHGWYFTAPSTHLQGVSRTYKEYHPDDNLGCKWSDPDLDIPWPEGRRLISERAETFPPLHELLDKVSIPYRT
jgi:dTDP-4-dehydrorhamnose 3,5-epimerase